MSTVSGMWTSLLVPLLLLPGPVTRPAPQPIVPPGPCAYLAPRVHNRATVHQWANYERCVLRLALTGQAPSDS